MKKITQTICKSIHFAHFTAGGVDMEASMVAYASQAARHLPTLPYVVGTLLIARASDTPYTGRYATDSESQRYSLYRSVRY